MTDSVQSITYQNAHYKSDTHYVIKVAKILLVPIGIWPLSRGSSLYDKMITLVHNSLIFCIMCFLLIPHFIYTFRDAEDKTKMMKVIAAQVFSFLAVIKFLVIVIHRRKIRFCLEKMKLQYRHVKCEEDRQVMIKNAKIGRLFTTMYLSLCYGGAFPYHVIMPFMAEKIIKKDNTTQLPLPYLSNFVFFEVEESPLYEIIFVSQIFVSSIILSTNCGIYSLITLCVMHSCSLFELVCRQMEIVLEKGVDDNVPGKFASLIKQHLEAIKYAKMIEDAFNIVFLIEMVGCTIVICFLEYGVLKDMEDRKVFGTLTYFILMTAILVNVFILSFTGNRLKEKSENVGKCTYSIGWYDLPTEISADIILIMLRCGKPSRLTAGKIFNISLQGFCDVVKTSAAYLNVIRTVTS